MKQEITLIPALPDDAPELGPILAEVATVVVRDKRTIEIRYKSPYRELLAQGGHITVMNHARPAAA